MRTEADWDRMARPKVLKQFTPRLQQLLTTIPPVYPLDQTKSYYIWGPVGTGKTVLAASMLLEAKKQMWLSVQTGKVLMIPLPELIQELTATFGNKDQSEQEVLALYSGAAYLIIDDFGAERPTEYTLSALYLIINRRFEYLRPTVFTSNLSLAAVAEKFDDDRITSRIELMCDKIIKKKPFK